MAPQIKSVLQNIEPLDAFEVRLNNLGLVTGFVTIKMSRDPIQQKGRITMEITQMDYAQFEQVYQNFKQEISN